MRGEQSLGEFEELVLLMVAALHDKAYGVAILESLEVSAGKKFNIRSIASLIKFNLDKIFFHDSSHRST